MSLRIRVTPEALADLDEAQDWYQAAEPGLGARFLETVEESVRMVADWPEAAPVVLGATRRILVPRFPYALYYVVEEGELVVLACIHARRHPRVWRRRSRRSPEA